MFVMLMFAIWMQNLYTHINKINFVYVYTIETLFFEVIILANSYQQGELKIQELFLMNKKENSFYWLLLAISSLGIAGLYSIFLVVLRSPGVSDLFPKEIFVECLIVHVNLSISVWFLSFLGLINSLNYKSYIIIDRFNNWSLACCYFGAILLAISPLFGGDGHKNNYVPMLENFVFIFGLAIFLAGISISCIGSIISSFSTLFNVNNIKSAKPVDYGVLIISLSSSFIFLLAIFCFLIAGNQLKKWVEYYDFTSYCEQIFWGFGHVVQFVYLQIYMFALVCLYQKYTSRNLLDLLIVRWIMLLNCIIVLSCPLFYYLHEIESGYYRLFFTNHMRYFGGLAIILLILVIVIDFIKNRIRTKLATVDRSVNNSAIFCFICSVLMFGFGGLIGFNIEMENVVVPAHYHGSIVAITTAFMGICYIFLGDENSRKWQIASYTIGQLMHIGGLALAGGYGALRKTPGVDLAIQAKIYLGIMGLGGLIAIISGIFFVVNCFKIIVNKK
jgi:hypothetical protein